MTDNPQLLAIEAQRLMQNPGFRKAVADLEYEYVRQIVVSDAHDSAHREVMYHRLQALKDVLGALETIVSDAQVDAFNESLRNPNK